MPIPSNLSPAQVYAAQFINNVNNQLANWDNILTSGSYAVSGSTRTLVISPSDLQTALSSSYSKIQGIIAAGQ